ncbi:MAG: formylglycine-generating enzyme family protein [Candidatus Omnitrophica bacterium]|nr:formylglycine-generating enzyme family protein [Candidatus Omnitrophota bacterium]
MLFILTFFACLIPDAWSEENFEPETVFIPAGTFTAGSSDAERSLYRVPRHESAAHRVYLPAYWIGRYEATNEQYEIFIEDGGYDDPSYWTPEGWKARQEYGWSEPRCWRDPDYRGGRHVNLPVCALSWHEAQAYCRWLSQKTGRPYRLPTEMEWEKAARGEDGRIFPWGGEWGPNFCNWYGYLGEMRKKKGDTDRFLGLAPVGSFENGKSPWGCFDMAGNVLEWCSDPWSKDDATYRVFRGGCFRSNNPRFMRAAWRGGTYPDVGHVYWGIIGFRVARDAESEESVE